MLLDSVLLNEWHVVARSSDLAEASLLGARVLEEELVLWRVKGRANVWQDLCVHRGTRLTLGAIENDRLVCGYHGWTYNADGECVRFPAHPEQTPPPTAKVRTYQTEEKYGLVWACLGESPGKIPAFPEWDDPSYRKIFCGPYRYRASGPRAVENFLDVAHLPFLHAGYLGEKSHAEIQDYQVDVTDGGIEARDVLIWQPDPDGTGIGKNVNYTYRVLRPLTMSLSKKTEEGVFSIFATVTPVSESESVAWFWLALNYSHEMPEEELRAFQDKITDQDIPVVESQRPEKLPLDLQAELHLRSDRIAVAYRKWLRQLGLTFGTA
ncbi:MAG: aromatic ring-hydroxylating dioxygenase subunit alpha [Thaumarchaeota archaeon]|nr:aromatic ring-hydroxylating dioxygenase subunit alpha [Nitrososphaerota archaeon]